MSTPLVSQNTWLAILIGAVLVLVAYQRFPRFRTALGAGA